MNITQDMTSNATLKAARLIQHAALLGMDVGGYGELAVNPHSGNTYLWLEDYNFCLYLPVCSSPVMVCYSCPIDGEETCRRAPRNIAVMDKWLAKCEAKTAKKEG
jgi:hypothetical protein